MHLVALGLLWLSGGWPMAAARAFGSLLGLTTILYLFTSFGDPGYIHPMGPGAEKQPALAALAQPLMELPTCIHCNAPQPPRTKVPSAAAPATNAR